MVGSFLIWSFKFSLCCMGLLILHSGELWVQRLYLWKDTVRDSVGTTYSLEKYWLDFDKSSNEAKDVVWRYICTTDGMTRFYPCVQLRKDYDPNLRPWYVHSWSTIEEKAASLKLDFYDKKPFKYTKDKNLVWNQYTLFDSPRFIYSECGSSPVQTCTNKRTLFEEK